MCFGYLLYKIEWFAPDKNTVLMIGYHDLLEAAVYTYKYNIVHIKI